MRPLHVLPLFALALAGCTTGGRFVEAVPTQQFVASRSPEVIVNAPADVVRSVIAENAARRGSNLFEVGGGLALQAPLGQTTPEVAVACGPHIPGRQIRVLLRANEQGQRTRLTEERFIVDGGRVCPMPMVDADVRQAIGALNRVKDTSEQIQRRFDSPTGQRNT